MAKNQSLKLKRSVATYDSRELAIKALDQLTFSYGDPVILKYKFGSELNIILAVGVSTVEGGAIGSYRIISDSRISESKYDSKIEDLVTPNPVGGISAGTNIDELRGQTFIKLFDDLLFPTILPIASNKGGLSLSRNPNNSLFEIGVSQQFTFTPTFNRGSYSLNGVPISGKYYLGVATNYEYIKGDSTVQTGSIGNYSVKETITKGITSYKVISTYGDGDIPKDNKGEDHPEIKGLAGTKEASINLEGTYPWFATSDSVGTFTKQQIRSLTSKSTLSGIRLKAGNVSMPQSFKFPVDMFQPTSIKILNNLSGKYDIVEPMDRYTVVQASEAINGSQVNYNIYIYNGGVSGPVRGDVTLELYFN